ncbi:MAG TPA: GGDEF domain-containing protein [Solirubrobacterales bacterium]|nr:GGDEF domain-containing protein [Solirubrobacterales bacterium]
MSVIHTARPARSGSEGALRLAIGVVLFGGTALVALHDWAGIGGFDSFVNGPLYDAVIVSAGLACLLKARGAGAERNAWIVIAIAVFSWAAGEIYWTAEIEGNSSAPYPSPADIGYLVFYPLAVAGLVLLVRARAHQLDWRLWVDGSIASLGTAALGAAIVFEFVADRTSGSTLEMATTLAYPLGDILLVSLVVGVVALTRWRPGPTWTLLLAGLATMGFADIAYTLETNGVGILDGDWVEPIYLLAASFVGAVLWQLEAATIQPHARFEGWRELAVPGFFALVMIGLFSIQYFQHSAGLTSVLWAATMLAVLARLAISVRENKRLLDQVRTDQLTGLGNRGRLQIDLPERVHEASERPLTLVMLDLNGFKHYNDTFGHPAGDEMLTWMGARLREALGKDGQGYRIGGDEFVVLIDCEPERHEAVVKRATEALTARGRGYEIGAAWGKVAVPDEAETPSAAMQLADVRMYAQKESRRTSHPDGIEIDGGEVKVELDGAGSGEALEQRK